MVFYFASPKYNPLINKVLTETDQVIAESIVGNDLFLKKTMKDKLASIASIDIIIVDFTALADTDAEIMEAVESIRIMDYKVRFIFVMPYKAEGDPFLKECFYAGIYDLIISDQYLEISEQLAVCVTDGMRYKDALEGKDGKEISVAKKEIYDEMQTSIVEKAMSMDQNIRDQIDLIGNPKLSASQMDQILNGINDGLQPLLVAQYASPKIPAWQMDIYRYGMLNGLGYDQIKAGCLQDWDSSRNNIDNMIKEQRGHIVSDLKANNYIPEKRLVHKIGRLNGLTGGKFNKVSDIVNSVKSGKLSNRYGEASLLKEIGEDLQHQRRVMSPAAQQKIHADAVPTR